MNSGLRCSAEIGGMCCLSVHGDRLSLCRSVKTSCQRAKNRPCKESLVVGRDGCWRGSFIQHQRKLRHHHWTERTAKKTRRRAGYGIGPIGIGRQRNGSLHHAAFRRVGVKPFASQARVVPPRWMNPGSRSERWTISLLGR